MTVRAAACLVLKQDEGTDSCADPIASWYFDRFAKGNFSGISESLIWNLQFLEAYVEPDLQSRGKYLIPQARAAAIQVYLK